MEYFPTIEYIKIYMKGIKLTPLMMFMLLVAVLIISMLLRYSIKEGSANMSPDSSTAAETQVFAPYDSRSLAVIKSSTDTEGTILFDPKYGNIVNVFTAGSNSISENATDLPFTVVGRNGISTSYTPVNGTSSEWETAKQQMQTIGDVMGSNTGSSSNFAWSYDHFNRTVLNVTWDKKTIIYLLNDTPTNPIMENVYISTYLSDDSQTTVIDDSIKNTPLPTTKSGIVNASSQNKTQVNGSMAHQISDNVFFSHENGILIKTPGGYNIVHNSQYNNGSIMKTDTQNNTAVVATKFKLDTTPSAIVIIISVVDGKSGSLSYQLTATARVTETPINPSSSSRPGARTKVSKRICPSGYEISGTHNPATGQPYCSKGGHHDSDSDSDSDCEYDSPYILKTEIVPPVCPMCPNSGGGSTSGGGSPSTAPKACNITINTSGQLVDCSGNVVTPYSAPSTFGSNLTSGFNTTVQTTGRTIDSTVKSASNLVGGAVDTAGDVVNKGVGTAGDVVNKGLDTASKAVGDVTGGIEGTVTGLGKDVSNIVTGLSSDVSGVANKTVGSATGLASQAIGTTAGLAHDTGSGAYSLAEQAMYRDPNGISYNQYGQPIATQAAIYPGAPVYPTGMYQGFGSCGVPYYPPHVPDPMPITNDFSQFS